jgi:carbonic anhydrase
MPRLTRLIDGYRRFHNDHWPKERERWSQLAEGQSPKTMVIACADSRSDPAQIFDTAPGEIFVVRNIAALAPPFETTPGHHGVSAALEFGVTQLEVEEILVLGHGSCGGCAAALTGRFDGAAPGEGRFIANWVSMLRPVRDQICARHDPADPAVTREMEWEAVKLSLDNLRTFPFIAEREQDGRLKLHGAHFAIAEGQLYLLDEAEGTFHPVS